MLVLLSNNDEDKFMLTLLTCETPGSEDMADLGTGMFGGD